MASKNTSSSPNGRQKVQRSNSDSARWVAGLLLLFIGVFAASAVLFSFFTWAADQSGLLLSPEERATLGVEPGNLCGWAGARLGRLLVDNSFGVSGILIPVMVVLVGVRVIRQRPLLFNHSILSLFLILILGSLTLGFAFSDKWSLCSSTGWGLRHRDRSAAAHAYRGAGDVDPAAGLLDPYGGIHQPQFHQQGQPCGQRHGR
jgi:S-DNA-T family DNA segregation ATPase FtsK/SpoIIIE